MPLSLAFFPFFGLSCSPSFASQKPFLFLSTFCSFRTLLGGPCHYLQFVLSFCWVPLHLVHCPSHHAYLSSPHATMHLSLSSSLSSPHLRSHHPHFHPIFQLWRLPKLFLAWPSHSSHHLCSHPHFRPCSRLWGLPLLLLPWPSHHPFHPSPHLRSPRLCSPHQTTHLRMPHLALSFLVPLHPPSHPSHLSVHPSPHLRSHHPHLHPCFQLGKFL